MLLMTWAVSYQEKFWYICSWSNSVYIQSDLNKVAGAHSNSSVKLVPEHPGQHLSHTDTQNMHLEQGAVSPYFINQF